MSNISHPKTRFSSYFLFSPFSYSISKSDCFSLCSPVSMGSLCTLQAWSPRSFLSVHRTSMREIPNSLAAFREETVLRWFSRFETFEQIPSSESFFDDQLTWTEGCYQPLEFFRILVRRSRALVNLSPLETYACLNHAFNFHVLEWTQFNRTQYELATFVENQKTVRSKHKFLQNKWTVVRMRTFSKNLITTYSDSAPYKWVAVILEDDHFAQLQCVI